MEQNKRFKFSNIKYIIIIMAIIMAALIINVYAGETINGGTEAEIDDERTLVSMVAAISKGEDSDNKVNATTLKNLLNKYASSGVASVSQSNDTITVTFASTRNIYEANVNTGPMFDVATYTVTYDANEGSGTPDVQTKTKGENLTLSTTKPTRTGYKFLGWSTSSSATTAEYASGGTYTTDADVTLYAVWKYVGTYTITYNKNGASGVNSTVTVTKGESVKLSSKPISWLYTGYTFKGWATTSTATTATYTAGTTITPDGDMTLYAVWGTGSTSGGSTV